MKSTTIIMISPKMRASGKRMLLSNMLLLYVSAIALWQIGSCMVTSGNQNQFVTLEEIIAIGGNNGNDGSVLPLQQNIPTVVASIAPSHFPVLTMTGDEGIGTGSGNALDTKLQDTADAGADKNQQRWQPPIGAGIRDVGRLQFINKEVVENLVKQWAPVVWLAPEEEFLPLGVDEFLNHVRPREKGKTLITDIPIGEVSTKTYLVTNDNIDTLLEKKDSFIYGRNPSERPVPIYAVITLCENPTKGSHTITSTTSPPSAASEQMHNRVPVISTRGSYIPIFRDSSEDRNNTIRRSSRLYSVFHQRMRRDIMPPPPPETASKFLLPLQLVTGEMASTSSPGHAMSRSQSSEHEQLVGGGSLSSSAAQSFHVNNQFIANLADNVKFSGNDFNQAFEDSQTSQSASKGSTATTNLQSTSQKIPAFHVTYWMFYPYSQGKSVCTLSLGPLGRIPFPAVYGYCLGKRMDIGSHIGDWEHMTLYFAGTSSTAHAIPEPEAMYVSAHDAGAYYSYNHLTGSFEFRRQETRKGILQRPNFPKTVTTFNSHPVLFAAKGSHGLWTAPGKHRFVKVARLYDINGFGTPWHTWQAVDISYSNLQTNGRSLWQPSWLSFHGKWGNPKSKCHPFRRIGLNFCEYTDGPTGIPLKEPHFQCSSSGQSGYR